MNTVNTSRETSAFEPLALGLLDCATAGVSTETFQKSSHTPVDFLLRRSWERRFTRAIQALRRA